jgi:HAD superfamily hydrolase (TIGR01509 family)
MIKGIIFDVGGVLLDFGSFLDKKESIIEENIDLVKSLSLNYQLGVLSNACHNHAERVKDLGIYDHFNKVLLSCDTGFQKPEKEAYLQILEKMEISPEEALFIDDLNENIIGAESVGITGILYESPVQLRSSLEKLGIEV